MILIHPWHHYKKKDKDFSFIMKLMKVYGYGKILDTAPPPPPPPPPAPPPPPPPIH